MKIPSANIQAPEKLQTSTCKLLCGNPVNLRLTAERLRKLAGDNVPGNAKNQHSRGATANKLAYRFALISAERLQAPPRLELGPWSISGTWMLEFGT